jgi:polysaccharide export outer membrane protein
LRASDPIVIQLVGIPEPLQLELVVDDAGEISLPYLDPIRAEGQTLSELQRAVQRAYVEDGIYRRITVNVVIPTQSYFVRGEVRQPGRFPLTGGITVLQAIAAAGGYTEFANPRRINIIRDGETLIENARQMEQNPEEDRPVKAGDVIVVPRSIF